MFSEKNIWFGYSISIVVIVLVGVFSNQTLMYLEQSARKVTHSHVVLEQLNLFTSDLKDVQRSVRGYIIADNSDYLIPYQQSFSTVTKKLDTLRALTIDHPLHQSRIDSLQTHTAEFLSYYTGLIESRAVLGLDSVIAIVKEGRGRKTTDVILGIIDRMMMEERSLLDLREIEDRAAGRNMREVLLVGSAIALLFIVVSSTLVVRENRQRNKAEAALRLQASDLLTAKEKAESADRFKSIFLATMSHELRTPLNSIIGFTDIMQQGRSGPVNPEQHAQLGKVLTNARHLLHLINDILDISKIEAGKIEITHWPFHAGESIQKCVSMISPLAEQKGITLQNSIATSVGEMISDQRRFEQIVINILSNAVKYTERGSITVEARVIWEESKEVLKLRVIDTGVGIKEEDMQKLFQPFQRVNTGRSQNGDGTGLGLAICKKLSHLLGGDVDISSEYGKGSTVEISLPTKHD